MNVAKNAFPNTFLVFWVMLFYEDSIVMDYLFIKKEIGAPSFSYACRFSRNAVKNESQRFFFAVIACRSISAPVLSMQGDSGQAIRWD